MRFFSFILFLVLMLSLSIAGCHVDSSTQKKTLNVKGMFAFQSLKDQQIFKLKKYEHNLFAGTSDNLYESDPPEKSWRPLGLSGGEVRTFTILSPNELIVPVYYRNKDFGTIVKTIDKGRTWLSFRNNYGGKYKIIPTVMEQLPDNPTIIYAGGGGAYIAKTIDKGNHWKVNFGSFQSLGGLFFIKPFKNIIWAGGENAIFQPILIHSIDGGTTWHEANLLSYAGENSVYDLLLKQGNSDHILIVIGYGLLKSTDGGENWHSSWEFQQYSVNTLTHSARDPQMVYASGQNANGTLFFAASADFGDTWQTVEMPDSPTGIYVNDMVSVMQDGHEVLYLGTNKGVYSYTFEQ